LYERFGAQVETEFTIAAVHGFVSKSLFLTTKNIPKLYVHIKLFSFCSHILSLQIFMAQLVALALLSPNTSTTATIMEHL